MGEEQYPHQYESQLLLKNGQVVYVRPIVPSDGHFLVDLFNRMSQRSRYLRFMTNIQELPDALLYRFTHLDYQSCFAIACQIEVDGRNEIIAVARYSLDPDEHIAELGVAVRDDWQHMGVGRYILSKIISIGKDHGISRFGSMMDPQNDTMKKLLRDLGYQVRYFIKDGSYQVEISL